MPRPRRLVITAGDGLPIGTGSEVLMIDLTGIPNADARIPLRAVVEQQCDLLCWHEMTSGTDLPLWSD